MRLQRARVRVGHLRNRLVAPQTAQAFGERAQFLHARVERGVGHAVGDTFLIITLK